MTHASGRTEREELRQVIRTVRRRWRVRHVLTGALKTAGAIVMAVLIVGFLMSRWSGGVALTLLSGLLYLGVLAVAFRTLVRPLLRRVADRQVAHYLEEHEPELRAEILTAVEALEFQSDVPDPLLDGLVRSAVAKARHIEGGRRVDRTPLRRLSWSSAAFAAILFVALLSDPLGLRTNLPDTVRPWTAVQAASPVVIQVFPGDTALSRGAELRVVAQLQGFHSDDVVMSVRGEDDDQWDRWPMLDEVDGDGHEFVLFRVDRPLEYFVESNGVRSGTFRVETVDLPYVSRLELELHPPAYTGRPPETRMSGGDLVALAGTRVYVRAHPTFPVPSGRIVIDEAGEIPLVLSEGGVLEGSFEVERPGYYRVELDDDSGRSHRGTRDHLIELIEDRPPLISLHQPGRDLRATSVEEVYVEARASDDYAVSTLELVYSVNGGPPRTISLMDGSTAGLAEVSAGHTFFLEDYELEPGDLIAYHARALDGGPSAEEREARTDLFFIEVRPFSQEFRQADQAGGQQGGGDGQNEAMGGQFSQRQREIVTATFNVNRDWRRIDPERMAEDVATIRLAQTSLRSEVEAFLGELLPRLARMPEEMQSVAEILPRATAEMEEAVDELQAVRPEEALPPEQRALQHLLRAEAVFREVQLAQQAQAAGGGGGGNQPREDLADYFDLEMDRLRNQYEELQRGERQEVDRQMDETLQRLRELARRQEQEAERLRRAADRLPQGAAAGGDSQRRLADETEEAARELERLAREQSSSELAESARRLQEAAESMRRSAASRDSEGMRQASEAGAALEEARRLLDRNRSTQLDRDVASTTDAARRALDRQRSIESAVQDLPSDAEERANAIEPLLEEKDELVQELQRLDEDLRRLARMTGATDPEAERGFREAAAAIREGQISDRVEFSRRLVGSAEPERVREFEAQVTELLEDVNERTQTAAQALDSRDRDVASELAERTRELVRGAESMAERARQAAQPGQQDQQDQEGQAGQQGQDGQQGQAGQQDQQGQPGQDGQQGQPGQDGAQGQQGGGGNAGLNEEATRQMQREAGERRQQAEALRGRLSEWGGDASQYGSDYLDGVVQRFNDLETSRPYADPRELEDIQRELIAALRELDFVLRRHFATGGGEAPLASGSGEVPEAYRDLVEEYFRSLANQP